MDSWRGPLMFHRPHDAGLIGEAPQTRTVRAIWALLGASPPSGPRRLVDPKAPTIYFVSLLVNQMHLGQPHSRNRYLGDKNTYEVYGKYLEAVPLIWGCPSMAMIYAPLY